MSPDYCPDEYLQAAKDYWEEGYLAPNVESYVFRFYGRILRPEFGITGDDGEKLLDFGCGQGAATKFFNEQGFLSHGVDISSTDINTAQDRYPEMRDRFSVVDPEPRVDDRFFGGEFDVIIAMNSLYYYADDDLQVRLQSLYDMLKPGGIFYATMVSEEHLIDFENSEPFGKGLRAVSFETDRGLDPENYFLNFTASEEELKNKFSMFNPEHIGFWSQKLRSDESKGHHYTFVGSK